MNKTEILKIIKIYSRAWSSQDSNLILTIFTKDAIYQEWAFQKPYKGHKEIKKYWENKVVKEQSNIKFKLLDVYLDKERNAAIVEWEATFIINKKIKNRMKEVAILEFEDKKIKKLREYWANIEKNL